MAAPMPHWGTLTHEPRSVGQCAVLMTLIFNALLCGKLCGERKKESPARAWAATCRRDEVGSMALLHLVPPYPCVWEGRLDAPQLPAHDHHHDERVGVRIVPVDWIRIRWP